VNRFLQDAANILETASAAHDSGPSDIAILIDQNNQLRIVDACGWELGALRREYQAATAYSVKRTTHAIVVEAQQGDEQCTFKKTLAPNPLTALLGGIGIPNHLVRPDRMLLQ
jgi:hypothetical protein